MKAIITISLIILLTGLINAQDLPDAQIPVVVKTNLATAFPSATGTKWQKKKELYKASFKISKANHDVWISKEGKIEKHRSEIKQEELPVAAISALKKDFATYSIKDCEKTEEKEIVSYKVELKSEAGKKNVHFDKTGKLIEKKPDTNEH